MAQESKDSVAQIRIQVTDEAGVPVPRAGVALSTFNNWIPGRSGAGRDDYNTIVGSTDTNGMTVLKLTGSSGRYGCMALPLAGYAFDKGTEVVFTNSVSGRWEPWSPLVSIVLKRPAQNEAPAEAKSVKPADPAPGVSKDPKIGREDLFPPERR